MNVIAQCFAVGLGFATGLAGIVFLVTAMTSPKESRRHAEMLALHHRTEDRLREYTHHMAVVAEAAEVWMVLHPLGEKPGEEGRGER